MSIVIRPVGRRYLLEMEDITDRKVGHVFLSDSSSETTRVCKVIGVGGGEFDHALGKFIKSEFAVGDIVLISAFAGYNIDAKSYGYIGTKYKLVHENEIMARVEKEE